MVSAQYLLFFGGTLALLFYTHEVSGIRCYECNSHNDPLCAEDKPPVELEKDCSELPQGNKYTFCRKIKQIIEFSVNNLPADTRIIRSCGYEKGNYANRCYQRSGFGGRQEVCACDSANLCNSAIRVQKTVLGVFLAIIVTFLAHF